MSLNVNLMLEDIVEQINNYKKQLENTENAVQQIKGAIAACNHQMQLLVKKQNEYVIAQKEGEKANAIEEGNESVCDPVEHKDGASNGENAEASGSNCTEQSRQEQQKEQVE